MDAAVIKYYRRLLKSGFEHTGSFSNPSIFLDSVGERIRICVGPSDYIRIYISVSNNRIDDIKYLCSCDPAANVAVEILCDLVKGKRLEEVATTTEDSFFQVLGCRSEELRKKTKKLLELLDRGLTRYHTGILQNSP